MQPRVLEHDSAGHGEPPLVFIPGGMTGWHSLASLIPLLSRRRRAIRVQPIVNAEGGDTGRPGDPGYGADIERHSLLATLDAADVQRMHLAGWSNGGRIALDFALAHPERVITLTAIEPAAWWLAPDDADARGFTEFVARLAGSDVGEDDLLEFLARVGLGGPRTDFRASPAWPLWQRSRNALSWCSPRFMQTASEGLAGIERLDLPVLLLRGTRTARWLHGVVDVLTQLLPNATVSELAGGHACILESPDEFNAALEAHITAPLPQRSPS